jgi:hypothetical protein
MSARSTHNSRRKQTQRNIARYVNCDLLTRLCSYWWMFNDSIAYEPALWSYFHGYCSVMHAYPIIHNSEGCRTKRTGWLWNWKLSKTFRLIWRWDHNIINKCTDVITASNILKIYWQFVCQEALFCYSAVRHWWIVRKHVVGTAYKCCFWGAPFHVHSFTSCYVLISWYLRVCTESVVKRHLLYPIRVIFFFFRKSIITTPNIPDGRHLLIWIASPPLPPFIDTKWPRRYDPFAIFTEWPKRWLRVRASLIDRPATGQVVLSSTRPPSRRYESSVLVTVTQFIQRMCVQGDKTGTAPNTFLLPLALWKICFN